MKGIAPKKLYGEDPEFIAAWSAAIEQVPENEREMKREIMALCFDIERKVQDCSIILRDTNVIMARTIGTMIQAEARWNQA